MAHVGISQNLIARTRDKIKKMRDAEFKLLGDEPNITFLPTDPYLLKVLWGEHLHLRNIIPSEWKGAADRVPIKVYFDAGTPSYTASLHVTSVGGVETPPGYAGYYSSALVVNADDPQIAVLVEFIHKKREIENRWDNVLRKVTDFLGNCKSLNEAVKLWEDVKIYIHSEDLGRLEVKREKAVKTNAAADFLATMDTEELVGAAVIARLSGAA